MTDRPGNPPLAAGLYFVATPIGNARDITLRALDILGAADVLAAEDTRSLRRLMEIHGVPLSGRRVIAYHDHNGAAARPGLLAALEAGKSVAYASEAGMPLVADPGYALGRAAAEAGHLVTVAPGASAALAALSVSGLPSDRFLFAGFAPNASGARRSFLEGLRDVEATLILYESPKRLGKLLAAAAEVLGEDREAAMCRELTKRFEEVDRGSLGDLAATYAEKTVKGEVVVCIEKSDGFVAVEDLREALRKAMVTMPLKQAAAEIARQSGASKRDLYQLGLTLKDAD